MTNHKPFLSGRVPQELWDAVNANAKVTKRSRTEVMIAAIAQYLDLPITNTDPIENFAEINRTRKSPPSMYP